MDGPRKNPYLVILFVFFPLALGGLALGGADVAAGVRSYRWTTVRGVVLSSELKPSFLAPRQAEVRYRYDVDGVDYVSNRIWPGALAPAMPQSAQAARRTMESFPPGAKIDVYMNPRDPNETALLPGPGRAAAWTMVFLGFVALGAWSPLLLARGLKRPSKR